MMLIPCPHCGPRNEDEFCYGGQAGVPYPANPGETSDQEWAEYLFYRDNTKGPFAERWVHSAGCRRWFTALRDTLTYEFLSPDPRCPEPETRGPETRGPEPVEGPNEASTR